MLDHVDVSGIWRPGPRGADCPLTPERCNFYSDPGLAPGPGEGEGRDDLSLWGLHSEERRRSVPLFSFNQNCPIF